jgi:hypothetical protein
MKLKLVKNRDYLFWAVSENYQFAIGITPYLFNLMCIQVLHKSGGKFYVIREYKGYDFEKVNKLVDKLKLDFKKVPNKTKGKDWKKVMAILPLNKHKYIDDDKSL